VAWRVSQFPEVNHNYLRDHHQNLWFVVAAPNRARVDAVLARIAASTQLTPINLPMLEDYHIDLGFDLHGDCRAKRVEPRSVAPRSLKPAENAVLAELARGLAFEPAPYAALGSALGLSEAEVLQLSRTLLADGVIKRFGIVVRHHELGFNANAMVVWDIPDTEVAALGKALAQAAGVHLCYRRSRCLPDWPYNLFCMIHGQTQATVTARIAALNQDFALSRYPHAVLFSLQRYKQCGARYFAAA
jgi:DNA-binding Lrp family transcriptional regulator